MTAGTRYPQRATERLDLAKASRPRANPLMDAIFGSGASLVT